jgi:hypothetical protein
MKQEPSIISNMLNSDLAPCGEPQSVNKIDEVYELRKELKAFVEPLRTLKSYALRKIVEKQGQNGP